MKRGTILRPTRDIETPLAPDPGPRRARAPGAGEAPRDGIPEAGEHHPLEPNRTGVRS
jgi:hypothetical protein